MQLKKNAPCKAAFVWVTFSSCTLPSVPMAEFLDWPKGQGGPPTHWANCLYLEWFSEANGRVVIESADYELTISPPGWRLTPDEDVR